MSMTREEAIVLFEKRLIAAQVVLDSGFGSNPGENDSLYRRRKEMIEIALSALRPASREQVEKVWRGGWIDAYPGTSSCKCTKCGAVQEYESTFCCHCGAPMTDEAVDILLKRLEALKDAKR